MSCPSIRIVSPAEFDPGTAQTPGSERRAAIAPALGIASAIWGGLFEVKPGSRTGIHPHGEHRCGCIERGYACGSVRKPSQPAVVARVLGPARRRRAEPSEFGHVCWVAADAILAAIARQVTQRDFAISDTITGVNMRLTAGLAQHLNIDEATIAKWPDNGPGVMP